jgi:hypothetical protein
MRGEDEGPTEQLRTQSTGHTDIRLTLRIVCTATHHHHYRRAPSGNMSPTMAMVLQRKGMVNVMLDCYANDPHIPDADFIAESMCRCVMSRESQRDGVWKIDLEEIAVFVWTDTHHAHRSPPPALTPSPP